MADWRSVIERKTPRFRRLLVSWAKKPSTALSHEQEVGVKLEGEAFVAREPLAHLGMFVGGIIVEDHMHDLSSGGLARDSVEKSNELLMPMTLHFAADHPAVEHVERGEQRRRSMPFIVVGHGPGRALFERQAGLRAIECLDLAFFIDRQHDGVRGGIDIEPDDIAQLSDEIWVFGKLELANPVRLEAMLAPNALRPTHRDAERPWPSSPRSNTSPRPAALAASERRPARPHPARAVEYGRDGSCRAADRRSLPA
jgi:hypothetical protein